MTTNFIYITEAFPPSGMQSGIRALEISKRLVENNIYPIIITKKIDSNKIYNLSLIKEIPQMLKIYRTHSFKIKNKYIRYLLDKSLRLDYYLEWIPFAFFRAKRILRKNKDIKFIYTYGPPFYSHIIGYLLKLKFKVPLIVEYGDPWSFNPYHEQTQSILFKKLNLFIEKKILKSTDLIVSLSSAFRFFLIHHFPFTEKKPIISISTGLHIHNELNSYKKKENCIIITFTGALYGKRTIYPLLKMISELKKENFFENLDFKLKIFGYYNFERLNNLVGSLNIEDIVYLGDFITRSKALKEILHSNLALHIGENLNYPFIAFKVWDYISCRKKIIYLGREDSYTAKFIKKHNLGITIPINNFEVGKLTLRDILIKLQKNEYDLSFDISLLKKFSWDKRVKKFIERIIKPIKLLETKRN